MNDKQPKRKPLPWWVVLAGTLIAFVAIAALSLHILGRSASARWEKTVAELRARGEPITFEEIESRRATVEDEVNGALIIEELITRLGGPVEGPRPEGSLLADRVPDRVLVFKPSPAFDPVTGTPRYAIDASRKFLAENGELMARLGAIEGRATGRFTFQVDPVPLLTILHHLTPVRTAGKLLRLDAAIKLVDGDLVGASRAARGTFNLAATLRDEPMIISRLVAVAVQAAGVQTAEDILDAGELDDAELARLADVIDWHLANMSNRPAFWGERAIIISTIEAIAAGTLDSASVDPTASPATVWSSNRFMPVVLIRSNQLRVAEMLGELVSAADDPQKLVAAARKQETELAQAGLGHALAKILIPSLSRATVLMTRIRAELLCLRVGLAAERFRLAQGRFPESVDELIPAHLVETPLDPFTGTPLIVRVVDGAFLVYSASENEQDDGGELRAPAGEKRARDVGLMLRPPDRRGVLITDEPPPEDE